MHPAVLFGWKRAREWAEHQSCHAEAGCGSGPQEHHEDHREASGRGPDQLFGVRRPLRFMAHKLELDDEQVKRLAQILNDIKTERAQAAVDDQRTIAQIADALEGESFDASKAKEALDRRVTAARRLADEVLRTLERTHAMLNKDQRSRLAYLLRSGWLSI
ncbi:MAG: periplasmic heavy metal sensor [Deltaproteobacteria bacterium]|nr:periplasmic heavy metal sensor [Deltaproteobacteria bacterium]